MIKAWQRECQKSIQLVEFSGLSLYLNLKYFLPENHGLAKKENQIDYQKRQKEFFDHFLLKKPAEKWITEGISYQQKMKEREKAAEGKTP